MASSGRRRIAPDLADAEGRGDPFLVIGGILVVTAIVTGVLVTEREAHLVRLETAVSQLEGELRALESRLNRELTASPRPPTPAP